MALNLSLTHQTWANPISSPDPTRSSMGAGPNWVQFAWSSRSKGGVSVRRKEVKTRASLETVGTQVEVEKIVGKVTQVNKDTFWPIVNAAAGKPVVLDMYTQWCGPCKAMAPKFEKLAEENLDVIFLKLDCNQENKPLAKELGIKVVPTFKILKDGSIVGEVTGAKYDALVAAIQNARSS